MTDITHIQAGDELSVIPLKNVILFPRVAIPLLVQRNKSLAALDEGMQKGRLVVFVAQKNIYDDVEAKDLFMIGTVGRIYDVHKLADGSSKIDVEGISRVRIRAITQIQPYFRAVIEPLETHFKKTIESDAFLRTTIENFRRLIDSRTTALPVVLPDLINVLTQVKDPQQIVDLMTINLNLELKDQQEILETLDTLEALKKINFYVTRELQIIETEQKVAKETRKQLGKMQKEIFLREQMKSIEKELGIDSEKSDIDLIQKKIKQAGMPKDVEEKAFKELGRLEKMPAFSPEISYLRTYLDWLVDMPWSKLSTGDINLKNADKVLEEDHYGLKKVKERILEYLAVQKKVGKIRGPILCFIGPPGVGKTSLGKSIARSLSRQFVRVSLGGMRDEAEIRGHRRTYVGAMPGRIIQGIHTAKTSNPVFMLDEIDKLGMDFRGDPSAALLEALDPEQNLAFSDHYLEVPYDLSDVFFIATANMIDTIPVALRDRLEIIDFAGYTEDEKLHIAKKYLIPKLLGQHGFKQSAVKFADAVIRVVIQKYTREAGVRDLERQLATIIRKVTRQTVEKKINTPLLVAAKNLHTYLGQPRYSHQEAEKKDEIGVATGLAWTPVGGEVLTIEATKMAGKGRLILTGHLGEVMRESAQTAVSYARSKADKLKIKDDFYKQDIHIHVPSGAIPKDGPSAGITMTTATVSLLTGRAIKKEVGMTGEITLRGKVLPIGGVKEKVLAAHRAGLKHLILPSSNKKDLEDIPKEVRRDLKFSFVEHIDDVLKLALRP